VKKQQDRPVLITNAARSQGAQLRSREIRYITMMGIRIVCIIIGGILISTKPPLLPLWLILCAAGMVLLPWMAVLIANDGPAKSKEERASAHQRQAAPAVALDQHPTEERQNRTIDGEL
jgi:arginine exporter protein ArgO